MPQAAALPVVLGALGVAQAVQANVANKAAIKNSENAAANSQRQIGQNADTAFSRLGQYNQANPGIVTHQAAPAPSSTGIPLVGGQPHMQGMMGQQAPGGIGQGGLGGAFSAMTPEQIHALIASLGQGAAPGGAPGMINVTPGGAPGMGMH